MNRKEQTVRRKDLFLNKLPDNINDAATIYETLTEELGRTFTLMELHQKSKTLGLPHPHLSIKSFQGRRPFGPSRRRTLFLANQIRIRIRIYRMELLVQFLTNTGYYLADYRHVFMWGIGIFFVYLAIGKQYEPLLLLPIGFGVLVGNVPFFKGFGLGIYEPNSVLHYLYFGVTTGVYPSIVFLGLGAMTDFSSLLARPKLMLLGAAAQMGIFFTF